MNPSDPLSGSMPAAQPTPGAPAGVRWARAGVSGDSNDPWAMAGSLVSATFVWGGIGYALDRWVFGTAPVLMSIGFMVGFFAGMYLLYLKSTPVADDGAGHDGA